MGSASSSTASAFTKELDILSKLNHTNIVKLFGHWDKRNNTYIVCEFMEGGTLYSYLQDKSLAIEWHQATKLIKDIVNGMIYLHGNDILHLDLKSVNILLSRNKDLAKITDFGLSKISTITSMTAAVPNRRTAVGSTRWMAPEISQGKPCSRKSDVWSFGCIIIEFATRELPFINLSDSNVFVMLQSDTTEIPLVVDLDKIPSKIATLLSNCLKRNKDHRPSFESIKENILDKLSENELRKNLEHQNNVDTSKRNVVKTIRDLNTKLIEDSEEVKVKMKFLENQVKELKLEKEKQAHQQATRKIYCEDQYCASSTYFEPCQSPSVSLKSPTSSHGTYTGMTHVSRGSANGRPILQGPRGGLYYISGSGSRVHVKK